MQSTRLRFCFKWWRFFTMRNAKMRNAWISAIAVQIEETLRYSVNALKAHWQNAKYRRRVIGAVFRSWLYIARRNIQVRSQAVGALVDMGSVMLQRS